MFSVLRLICVAFLLKITEQKPQTASEVDQILDYLSQQAANNRARIQPSNYHEYQPGNKHSHAQDILETLNLFLKRSNLRDSRELDNDLEKRLRLENDNVCKVTGRCGCGGGRCGGKQVTDERTVDDIDKILKDLNENLNREQSTDNQFDFDANRYDDDDDNADISPILKTEDNKHKTNDNLDVIFLEVPDSEDKNLINLLRNLGDDVKIIDLRNIDLDKLLNNRKLFDKKSKNIQPGPGAVTLQDLGMYFNEGKREIIQTLIEYIKGKKYSSYLIQLTPYQNKQISNLKNSYSLIPLPDDELRSRITKIIFGPSSNIRILSQPKDNNIYIPREMFDSIQFYKEKNNLRSKKPNVLPLTVQQKARIKNKEERKIIPKHSWRRNMQENPKYGVPFQLNVQGLGQANQNN